MTDLEALKARLREVESSRPDIIGISTHWHRNPEGPEAADAIERLEAAVAIEAADRSRMIDRYERLEAENAKLREELRQIYVDATEQHADWCNMGPVENEARDWVFDLSQYALAALKG